VVGGGGAAAAHLDGPGLPVWSVAFAADGRTLWTGGQDRVVRRWDAATGAPLGPLASGADAAAAAAATRTARGCSAPAPPATR
jgi:cytochrome c